MNDFDYEIMQKKRLARQSSYRKCGSKSKKCPLSTDQMTKKQWEERCGEIMTYQLGKPMNWDEFKRLPANLQKEYLLDLIHKYSVTASDLAKMFGIAPQTVTKFCGNTEIGIKFSPGKRMTKDYRTEFEKFLQRNNNAIITNVPLSESKIIVQELNKGDPAPSMKMTEFCLHFEGTVNPEMIANSINAMLYPDDKVEMEIKCRLLL